MAGLGYAGRNANVSTISSHAVQWVVGIVRARAHAAMVIQPIDRLASMSSGSRVEYRTVRWRDTPGGVSLPERQGCK